MKYYRKIRGPFVSYSPMDQFGATTVVQIRTIIADDLKDTSLDVAIDLSKMTSIDVTGLRFLSNLRKALVKENRLMVFFAGTEEIRGLIQNDTEPFKMYESLEDFEIGFHDMTKDEYQSYFRLSQGKGPIRHLNLTCPICGNEGVKGFILDKKRHRLKWTEKSITPYYAYEDEGNRLDWDAYNVSVCSKCLFASSRLDFFHLKVEEGLIPSKLTEDCLERVGKKISQRKSVTEFHEEVYKSTFWGLPRERTASMISWMLNDMTERSVAKDRNHMDAFNIAVSCFMVCKFSTDSSLIENHLSTAMAWLDGILKKKEKYSSVRIAMVYTYLTSMFLFNDKLADARNILEQFSIEYKSEEWAKFWLLRAKELYTKELAED